MSSAREEKSLPQSEQRGRREHRGKKERKKERKKEKAYRDVAPTGSPRSSGRGRGERDGGGSEEEREDHAKEEGTHRSPPEQNAEFGALVGWVRQQEERLPRKVGIAGVICGEGAEEERVAEFRKRLHSGRPDRVGAGAGHRGKNTESTENGRKEEKREMGVRS